MRIGMTVPFMEPGWDRALMRQWAEAIDGGPWAGLALGERITFINPEFMTALAACAAWTERVELMSTISVLPMHSPVLLAKQFATIDVISDGRLTVGVGLGGRREDYDAVGADWKQRRLATLEAGADTMRRIWRGEPVVENAKGLVEPLPVQPDGPPILSGSLGPKSIHAAGRFADGLSGFSFTASLDEMREAFQRMRDAWHEHGRDGEPRLVASFWYGIEQKGREQMTRHLRRYLNFMPEDLVESLLPDAGFNGSLDELADFVGEVKALGADDLILVPTSTDVADMEAVGKALF